MDGAKVKGQYLDGLITSVLKAILINIVIFVCLYCFNAYLIKNTVANVLLSLLLSYSLTIVYELSKCNGDEKCYTFSQSFSTLWFMYVFAIISMPFWLFNQFR